MKKFCAVIFITLYFFNSCQSAVTDYDTSESFSRQLFRLIGGCSETNNIAECLGTKFIIALNRAARSNRIDLAPGVSFIRREDTSARSINFISDNEILSTVNTETENKNENLAYLALETGAQFLRSHQLSLQLPEESDARLSRALFEERGKKKKIAPLLLAAGAKLLTFLPLFVIGLGFLAIKAAVVSKIALMVALALVAKNFFGGVPNLLGKLGGGASGLLGGSGLPSWSTGGAGYNAGSYSSGSYGNYRNFGNEDIIKDEGAAASAQDFAYSGHIQS